MGTAVASGYTVDEFLALPESDDYELIDGELKERDMGSDAVWISGRFMMKLGVFNESADLGLVYPDGATVAIFPLRPRHGPRPDGAFISYARLGRRTPPRGALTVAPELIIEVVSTHDNANDLEGRVRDYLAAGVDLVWVAYPEQRVIHVYRRDGTSAVIAEPGDLSGEGILPGFSVPVSQLFPRAE
jgi:Uma2 family endonuclease